MRLPPLRPALIIALTLALAAIAHAQYGGPPTDAQRLRTLQNEGQKFRDILSSQRNTPSPRRTSGPIADEVQLRAREQARNQAYADRRAAERYADSEAGRAAAANARYQRALQTIAEEKAAKEARIRAVQAEHQATLARQARESWEKYRAENHNFTPRAFAPGFATTADALAWYLAHDRESPNPWAASQAAILLIDGYGVPADPTTAARLLDPRTRREPAGEQSRPEPAALFAYLRAVHPETCVSLGVPADPAAARRDLEAFALLPHNDVAHWYLARLLGESPDLADQKKALTYLPEGYAWMIKKSAALLQTQASGSFKMSDPVDATAIAMLARATDELPAALATWPLEKISAIAELVTRLPEPQRHAALLRFADAAAERFLTRSPSPQFPYKDFDYLLVVAGGRGSSSAHAIALFERLHLIRFDAKGDYTPSFLNLTDRARPIPALSRWARRDDPLGVRARLALAALAFEIQNPALTPRTPVVLPEPFASVTAAIQRYRDAAYVDTAHYVAPSVDGAANKSRAIQSALQAVGTAMARRDAAAPPVSSVPAILDGLTLFQREQDQLVQLNEAPALLTPADPALFAVEAASFDLDRAAARFDLANTTKMVAASGRPERFEKLHALYEATRLGDAFAPTLLSQDPDFRYVLTSEARDKLHRLSDARRARDEAARRPRALTARIVEACFNQTEFDPAFVPIAAANGSRIAARLQFDQRLKASLPTDTDAPASASLKTALIDEFDATLLALDAQPPVSTAPELQLLWLLMTRTYDDRPVEAWFPHVIRWTKDRDERLASAALVQALRPSFEALVVTLGEWPGINHEDSRNEDWLNESDEVYHKAKDLIATDGLAALTLCLEAAGRGNRDALDLLAYNLRHGLGTLPRSPEFADLLVGASLKIAQADAEVGDATAAHNLGLALMEGDSIAKNSTAGRDWLRYSAQRGNKDAAGELRRMAERNEQPGDPAAERHWKSVGIMIRASIHIPVPPRRPGSDVIELTPLLPALEAALTAAQTNLKALKPKRLTDEETGAAYDLAMAAFNEARYTPATGIVSLANLAATGNQDAAFITTQFLAGGLSSLRPDPALARRFRAHALALQQISAELGDADEAHLLGLHHLEFAENPDPAAAIRWLTYAAELGHTEAVICLQTLYTTGAPGIPVDAKAAARWTAFGETMRADDFKPRAPLRK